MRRRQPERITFATALDQKLLFALPDGPVEKPLFEGSRARDFVVDRAEHFFIEARYRTHYCRFNGLQSITHQISFAQEDVLRTAMHHEETPRAFKNVRQRQKTKGNIMLRNAQTP